jgi:hypothetical protein
MPSLLSLLGILKWPATVTAAFLVFAMATQASLSLLTENVTRSAAATHATIKAGMATPVIRMPDTPAVSPAAVRARVAAVPDGRRYALAAAAPASATPGHAPARMVASTGLIARSQPKKASDAMGSIPRGATVEVRSKRGGWFLVDAPAGITGWVFGKYLTPAGDG